MRTVNLTKSLLLSTALVSIVSFSFASDQEKEKDGNESTKKFVASSSSSHSSRETLLKIAAPLLREIPWRRDEIIEAFAAIPENNCEGIVKFALPFHKGTFPVSFGQFYSGYTCNSRDRSREYSQNDSTLHKETSELGLVCSWISNKQNTYNGS